MIREPNDSEVKLSMFIPQTMLQLVCKAKGIKMKIRGQRSSMDDSVLVFITDCLTADETTGS